VPLNSNDFILIGVDGLVAIILCHGADRVMRLSDDVVKMAITDIIFYSLPVRVAAMLLLLHLRFKNCHHFNSPM
jgi:hypothetical protein